MKRFWKHINFIVIFCMIVGILFIYRDVIFNGKILFPSNFLAQFYSPWRTERIRGWEQGVPHKPIGDDQIRIFYPSRTFTNEMISKNMFPLWNPHIFSGTPHLADFQSAVFYPFNLLYIFLPQIPVWSFLLMIQPIMATLFAYLFLRFLKLHTLAAWLGAIGFGFSGFILVWSQENVVVGQAALWLPLALWGIEGFLTTKKRTYYLMAVLALTCSFLAGFFQVTFYIFALAFFYSLFRIFSIKGVHIYKAFLYIGSIYFFSLSLSAIQLLPSIEAFAESPRLISSAWYLFESYLLPITHIFNALVPDIFGNPAAYNFFGRGFYRETILYIGVIPLIFALYAIAKIQKNNISRFFTASAFLTFFLALNSPFTKWFFSLPLPLLPTFLPSRILILTSFSLAVLSAFGLSAWLESKKKIDRKFLYSILIILLPFLSISLYAFISLFNFDHFDQKNMLSRLNFEHLNSYMIRQNSTPTKVDIMVMLRNLFLPFAMILLLGILVIFKKRNISVLFIVILTLLGQLYFLNKYSIVGEPQFLYPKHAALSFLQSKNSLDRFLSFGQPIHENTSIIAHIYSVEGVNPIFPSRYGQLLFAVRNKGKITNNIPRVEARLSELDVNEKPFDNNRRLRLLSLLGVRYILYSLDSKPSQDLIPPSLLEPIWNYNKWYAFEYKKTLPRAFFARNIHIEKNSQRIIDLIFDSKIDLSSSIILEEKPIELNSSLDYFKTSLLRHSGKPKAHPESPKEKSDSGQARMTDFEMTTNTFITLPKPSTDSFASIISYKPQEITIRARSNVPQMLFLSDNYYPGWKAYVDGKETKIYRADFTFRSIYLPKGSHVVGFEYDPMSFKLGYIVSSLSFIVLLLIIFKNSNFWILKNNS